MACTHPVVYLVISLDYVERLVEQVVGTHPAWKQLLADHV